MAALAMNKQELVADLTCGMGNFFNFVPVESNAYGCEIDAKAYKVAHYLYPAANLVRDDIPQLLNSSQNGLRSRKSPRLI